MGVKFLKLAAITSVAVLLGLVGCGPGTQRQPESFTEGHMFKQRRNC